MGPHTHEMSDMAEMTIEEYGLGNNTSTEGDKIGATLTGIHSNEAEVSS